MGNKEPSYTVEAIVGKKMIKDEPFYLVKWKDYDSDQNTWEPFRNLANCKGLVSKFERKAGSDGASAKKRRCSSESNDDAETKRETAKRRKTSSKTSPSCVGALVLTNSDSESPESLASSETYEETASSSSSEKSQAVAAPCVLVAFRDRDNRLLFVLEFEDGDYRVVDAKTARKHYKEALNDFLLKDAE